MAEGCLLLVPVAVFYSVDTMESERSPVNQEEQPLNISCGCQSLAFGPAECPFNQLTKR